MIARLDSFLWAFSSSSPRLWPATRQLPCFFRAQFWTALDFEPSGHFQLLLFGRIIALPFAIFAVISLSRGSDGSRGVAGHGRGSFDDRSNLAGDLANMVFGEFGKGEGGVTIAGMPLVYILGQRYGLIFKPSDVARTLLSARCYIRNDFRHRARFQNQSADVPTRAADHSMIKIPAAIEPEELLKIILKKSGPKDIRNRRSPSANKSTEDNRGKHQYLRARP